MPETETLVAGVGLTGRHLKLSNRVAAIIMVTKRAMNRVDLIICCVGVIITAYIKTGLN